MIFQRAENLLHPLIWVWTMSAQNCGSLSFGISRWASQREAAFETVSPNICIFLQPKRTETWMKTRPGLEWMQFKIDARHEEHIKYSRCLRLAVLHVIHSVNTSPLTSPLQLDYKVFITVLNSAFIGCCPAVHLKLVLSHFQSSSCWMLLVQHWIKFKGRLSQKSLTLAPLMDSYPLGPSVKE